MISTEREAYIALNIMPKIGPIRVKELINHLGSAKAIFEATAGDMAGANGIGVAMSKHIEHHARNSSWQEEQEKAEKLGIKIVTLIDPEYPELLKSIYDPPLALYCKGSLKISDKHSIAVVGTRSPTNYGIMATKIFCQDLCRAERAIISGLALGVDTHAHKATIEAKGRTIGVIGGGFNHFYPPQNMRLADEIVASGGAILSEFPLDKQPDRTTFPMRNRIVSGISAGTLVIEAAPKSGALITSSLAMEQGRCVFAVPGRIDSPKSFGPNNLIASGAKLVRNVKDILDEFETLIPTLQFETKTKKSNFSLDIKEEKVFHILKQGESDLDTLIRETGLSASALNAVVIKLELKKIVKTLPGGVVELVRMDI
ncbi:MAG: DNA-processing protein DprA [Kiritimatiellae bacterium]|nr:DNA-processing protein DprA [Kiritimatiellia bacterium]